MVRQKIRKEQKKNSAQKLFKFPTALCSAGKRTRAQADMLMTSMLTKYRTANVLSAEITDECLQTKSKDN